MYQQGMSLVELTLVLSLMLLVSWSFWPTNNNLSERRQLLMERFERIIESTKTMAEQSHKTYVLKPYHHWNEGVMISEDDKSVRTIFFKDHSVEIFWYGFHATDKLIFTGIFGQSAMAGHFLFRINNATDKCLTLNRIGHIRHECPNKED